MIYHDCEAIIDNCLFYNNETYDGDGGAVEVYESSGSYFINCTFADNHASFAGGAIDSYISMATLTNCILWGNTADVEGDQVYISSSTAGLNFYHCNSQGGDTAFGGYANNGEIVNLIKDDPIFYEIAGYPYGFREGSPCMNVGSLDTLYLPENWGCPCLDLADNTRIRFLSIDLGAYEAFPPTGRNESIINNSYNLITFPNPTTDNLTLTYKLQNTSVVNISLYSITGEKLEILSNQMTPVGEHQQYIDVTSLPVGTYFLKLQIGDEVVTKKVVKL